MSPTLVVAMMTPIMAMVVVASTEVEADARPVAADPTTMPVPTVPPATTIGDLLGEG